jgi:hypothetical protein
MVIEPSPTRCLSAAVILGPLSPRLRLALAPIFSANQIEQYRESSNSFE